MVPGFSVLGVVVAAGAVVVAPGLRRRGRRRRGGGGRRCGRGRGRGDLRTEAAGCTCTGSAASGALPTAPFFTVVFVAAVVGVVVVPAAVVVLPLAVVVVPPAAVVVEPGFAVVVVAVPATAVNGTKSVTARNWSSAVRPTRANACWRFFAPGRLMTMVLPWRLTSGSATPSASTRLRDDLDRGVQGREVGSLHREEHDRDPALEVEAELGPAVAEEGPEEREQDQPDGDGEKPDLTAHRS